MEKKQGFIEKLVKEFIASSGQSNAVENIDSFHILNANELTVIRKVKRETFLGSALLGILGVLFLYLPQYWFPSLFPDTPVKMFGEVYPIPFITTLFGVVLTFLEIYGLNYLHARAVRKMVAVCGFLSPVQKQYDFHLQSLTDVALEKESKLLIQYGINPYLGIPKVFYYSYFFLNKLKATLSNLVFKLLIKRLLGRVVIRELTDMAGLPIFAFWNYWASRKVIAEATIRIMAPTVIQQHVAKLYAEMKHSYAFKQIIMDALQYAATLKRDYNFAHYLLAEEMNAVFSLDHAKPQNNFYAQLAKLDKQETEAVKKMLTVAVLIDGQLSWWEQNRIQNLNDKGIFNFDMDAMKEKAKAYFEGRGLVL
jgi:hypothetical protein